ncbi:MAG: OB-fold nucleic acid binding domain-containing protein [Actinobacteria bacterium]|jgi:RecG-like helicase|nr:OB-fold nucleic acid binding domain-containing protein [Actinomycetota bacterium]
MAGNQPRDDTAGGLTGRWRRWTRSQAEVEADELKKRVFDADDIDLTRIDCCTPGETVTVTGMVRSMTIRPRANVPALEVELYDGSGSVSVVWLGRRRIPGIDPGRTMVVRGRLTCNTDSPTIYNPKYELKPTAG